MKNESTSIISTFPAPYDRVLSPTETIREMWEQTDENGILLIFAWLSDEDAPENAIERCRMTWSKEEADRLAAECESLVAALKRNAAFLDGTFTEADLETLPEEKKNELRSLWETYFADSVENGNDAFRAVIMRARRICSFLTMGAPKIIIDNEAFFLSHAMAIHTFCLSREKIGEIG